MEKDQNQSKYEATLAKYKTNLKDEDSQAKVAELIEKNVAEKDRKSVV